MIYVLRLPSYACQALVNAVHLVSILLGEALSGFTRFAASSCKECAGPCQALEEHLGHAGRLVCRSLAGSCQWLNKSIRIEGPLGGLVLLALLTNIPALVYALTALSESQVRDCVKAPLADFCRRSAVMAAAHIAFAVYFKRRIDDGIEQDGLLPEHSTQLGARQIRQRVHDMAMYNPEFAAYFFTCLVSLYCNTRLVGMSHSCGEGTAWFAGALQLVYMWLAIQYILCWSCIQGVASWFERFLPFRLQGSRITIAVPRSFLGSDASDPRNGSYAPPAGPVPTAGPLPSAPMPSAPMMPSAPPMNP